MRRSLLVDRSGNIMLEFALALPVLFILLAGLLDLGTYAMQKSALLQGAREGAQYAMMSYSDSTNINATAQNGTGLTGVTATNSVFCECEAGTAVSCGSTCATGTFKRYITVNTNKTFTSVLSHTINFGSMGSFTPPSAVSASVTVRVQ
jgi:Flp pilus assembly protein TadG